MPALTHRRPDFPSLAPSAGVAMFRNIVLVSLIAGIAVYVPVLYHANPDAFDALLGVTSDEGEQRGNTGPKPIAVRVATEREPEILLGKKVRITAGRGGHFFADFKMNGRTLEAVVDTGATLVAINESQARRLGIRLTAADFRHEVNTANGKTSAAAARIETMQIGRIFVEDVPAVVLEDDALETVLVGMSFLNRLKRFQVEDGGLLLEQ